MKWAGLALVSLAGALALPSCGGSSSSSGASCTGKTSCGGDVVGTWKAETVCSSASSGSGSPFGSFCPTATLSTGGVTISGTFTFKADMTYTTALIEGGTAGFTLPNSCLMTGGVTVNCADLGPAANMGGDFSSASCQASGSNCVCSFSLKDQPVNESGTYSVTGTDLNMMPTGGTASSSAFCVSGNELHMSSLSTSMSMGTMGSMNVATELVAVKQ